MHPTKDDRRGLSEITAVPSGIALAHTLAICGLRGWWPAAVGCAALVVVCNGLAAVWEPTE
jgi:hypothetical protein